MNPITCPICCDDVLTLVPWGDPAICTGHAICTICTVRHLRLELGHPAPTRVSCPEPGCGEPISEATLATAAAWGQLPAHAAGNNTTAAAAATPMPPLPLQPQPAGDAPLAAADPEVRPLSAEAVSLAEVRRRAAMLSRMRAAIPGIEVHFCPHPRCNAILTGEPPQQPPPSLDDVTAAGTLDEVGRLALCPGCGGEVCSVCCQAWVHTEAVMNGMAGDLVARGPIAALGAASHRGKTCESVRRERAATAATAATVAGRAAETCGEGSDFEAAFGALMGSVKQCPQCGVGVSHYRGHACHHIEPGRYVMRVPDPMESNVLK